jgi:hypothetical protein
MALLASTFPYYAEISSRKEKLRIKRKRAGWDDEF